MWGQQGEERCAGGAAGAPPEPGALPMAGGARGAAGARVWLLVSDVVLPLCSTSAAHGWFRMLGVNTEQEGMKFP